MVDLLAYEYSAPGVIGKIVALGTFESVTYGIVDKNGSAELFKIIDDSYVKLKDLPSAPVHTPSPILSTLNALIFFSASEVLYYLPAIDLLDSASSTLNFPVASADRHFTCLNRFGPFIAIGFDSPNAENSIFEIVRFEDGVDGDGYGDGYGYGDRYSEGDGYGYGYGSGSESQTPQIQGSFVDLVNSAPPLVVANNFPAQEVGDLSSFSPQTLPVNLVAEEIGDFSFISQAIGITPVGEEATDLSSIEPVNQIFAFSAPDFWDLSLIEEAGAGIISLPEVISDLSLIAAGVEINPPPEAISDLSLIPLMPSLEEVSPS